MLGARAWTEIHLPHELWGENCDFEQLAAEIRWHKDQAEQHDGLAWKHRFEMGLRMHIAKQELAPGQFGPWIERETGITDRHARRLMLLWRERTRVSEMIEADPELSLRAAIELLRAVSDQVEETDQEPPAPRPTSLFDTDPEALGAILAIHAQPVKGPRVIDVTYSRGSLWKGLRGQYRPVRVDLDPLLHAQGFTEVVASWDALPYEPGSFDVLVFDPPHTTDAGAGSLMGARYSSLKGISIAGVFEPMLREARRLLVPGTGLLIAKLANQVHNSRYQDQAREFANAAEALGFEKVDEAIRHAASRGALSGAWETVQHLRQVHTYWLALRAPRATG